jgi:hypothetical protein
MVIIFEPYGQLGNRLFLSAYGMALARASGQDFLNFTLDEYENLFPAMRTSLRLDGRFHSLMRRVILRLKRLSLARQCFVRLDRENAAAHSPDNPSFVAAVRQRPLTIIEGWPDPSRIRFPAETARAIRRAFQPAPEVMQAAQDIVRRARARADVLVGLHIRLTDYREYGHGIFYHKIQDYRRTLEKMSRMFPGRRVAFLICSDERQEAANFAPFPVTLGQGTLLGDLFSLAGCDYVVGPPSTYSLWAAFYGRKPLYHMIEPEPPSDLSSFMVPEGRFDCIDLKLHDREIERRRLSRVHHTGVQ